ncbi:unnamed protein product [Ectocarpus sp. 13 AM-2016]
MWELGVSREVLVGCGSVGQWVSVHGQNNAANPLVRVVCKCTVCMSSAGSHRRVFTLSISRPSLTTVTPRPAFAFL